MKYIEYIVLVLFSVKRTVSQPFWNQGCTNFVLWEKTPSWHFLLQECPCCQKSGSCRNLGLLPNHKFPSHIYQKKAELVSHDGDSV